MSYPQDTPPVDTPDDPAQDTIGVDGESENGGGK